jgi:hypothetical protein
MGSVSRRSFLVGSSASAIGVAGVAGLASKGVRVAGFDDAEHLQDHEVEHIDLPVLLHIRDAAKGHVEVLVAEHSVRFTDKALVAKVLRAAR